MIQQECWYCMGRKKDGAFIHERYCPRKESIPWKIGFSDGISGDPIISSENLKEEMKAQLYMGFKRGRQVFDDVSKCI